METTKAWVCPHLTCVWLFCNPMDCSPTGTSVHGISQARIVEWFAISSSRGSSRSGMQQCLFHLLHRQVDSLPLSHQRGPDQETAPRNFRALEIREDTKNFWKGKKKCHTLFIRQSLTGEEIISLCQGLKSVKFFFYKTVTEMFRTRKDTHQSKVVFSHKILSFLLKSDLIKEKGHETSLSIFWL